MTDNTDSVARTLAGRALAVATKQGLSLEPGLWGVRVGDDGRYEPDSPTCCPLGVLLIGTTATIGYVHDAATMLGYPHSWIRGFTDAYDQKHHLPKGFNSIEESYRVGHRVGLYARFILHEVASE